MSAILLNRGTQLGSQIRTLLLNPEHSELHAMTEILLYAADRAQHVYETVRPHLEAGGTVICERYTDSSLAYQGYGLGLDIEGIRQINHWATEGSCRMLPYTSTQSPLSLCRKRRAIALSSEL